MRTYLRHYCTRSHRNWRSVAKCLWPRAAWIDTAGLATLGACAHQPVYAVMASCRALTVSLHHQPGSAEQAKRLIDDSGCGGACPCTGDGHVLFQLDPGLLATLGGRG